MAYPYGTALVQTSTAATEIAVTLPTNVANDLIVIFLSQDGGGTTIAAKAGTTGWTIRNPTTVTGNARMAVAYKLTSGSEATPTFTGANDEWLAQTIIIKDADTTTPINTTSGTGYIDTNFTGTSGGTSSGSLTTGAGDAGDGALLLYGWCSDGSGIQTRTPSNDLIELSKYADTATPGTIQGLVGYRVQGSAGAAPTVKMYSTNTAEGGNGWVLAVKNKSGGIRAPDCRNGLDEFQPFGNFAASYGTTPTWTKPDDFAATINGIPTRTTIATGFSATTAASITYPWGLFTSLQEWTNLASASWAGATTNFAAKDMSGKIFTMHASYSFSGSNASQGVEGEIIGFKSAADYWTVYQIRSKATVVASADILVQIALGQATVYATGPSGPCDFSAVTDMCFFIHRAAGNSAQHNINIKNACLMSPAQILSGGEGNPSSFTTLATAMSSWGLGVPGGQANFTNKQASSQVVAGAKVQLGDGSTPTYFDSSAQSFEFPLAYSLTAQPGWNVNASQVELRIKPSASDTILLSAGVLATNTAQAFVVDSGSSLSANVSFSGESFVGFTPTWDKDIPVIGATFKSCATVDFGGADVTNCTIANSTSANAAVSFDTNGAVMDGCTITLTAATTNYHIALGASVTAFEINGTTLAGTPVVDKFYSELASGTLTITTDGLGTALVAGDVTFIGGSTAVAVIAAPELYQEVAIIGLAATYRLQIFDIEYVLTVSGITVTPTAGATYTHNGITWTVRSASITAGSGTITVYGTGTPATSGTLTKTGGTGDASVAFSAYVVDGTELYIGVPGATSYTWTDSVAAAAPRVIRVRVMEDGPGTSDAIEMIDAIVGMCGITEGTESVGYLVAAVADDVYNDRGVDGSTITGITIDDTALRLEIASGTITNFNGTDVLVVDGRDLYAYETYWLGTTAGMRDEARFIEAIDAVNFRCSNFKLKGTSGYPIMINNCFIVDAATGIFSSMVDYSGDPISNHPEHMKAIVVTTSDSVVTGTLAEFIAAVPTANDIAQEVVTGITF